MIFAAAVLSSRTRIPHTMILVAFGIAISFFDFVGLNTVDIKQFRIDPRLVINFIIPPLIAMIAINQLQLEEKIIMIPLQYRYQKKYTKSQFLQVLHQQ